MSLFPSLALGHLVVCLCVSASALFKHIRCGDIFSHSETHAPCVSVCVCKRGESLGGGCYDRVLWAWSSATHYVQCARKPSFQSRLFPSVIDVTELLITPNNKPDT